MGTAAQAPTPLRRRRQAASPLSRQPALPPPPPHPKLPSNFHNRAGVETAEGAEGEEAGEGKEGVEGVDWRYGSVQDLDPSEWQVLSACVARSTHLLSCQKGWHLCTARYFLTNGWAPCCMCLPAAPRRRRKRVPTPAPCAWPAPLLLQVPPHCIPIHANVTTYDWSRLIRSTQVGPLCGSGCASSSRVGGSGRRAREEKRVCCTACCIACCGRAREVLHSMVHRMLLEGQGGSAPLAASHAAGRLQPLLAVSTCRCLPWLLAQFDVIMMDPPWQLATANPTRGVALGYSQVG